MVALSDWWIQRDTAGRAGDAADAGAGADDVAAGSERRTRRTSSDSDDQHNLAGRQTDAGRHPHRTGTVLATSHHYYQVVR